MSNPGELLRKVRLRHGVSQKRLAMRAGTTQSAISRIERNRISPSVEALHELLFLLGEDLVLDAQVREMDVDREALRGRLRLSPDERIRQALAKCGRAVAKRPADQVIEEYIVIADEQQRQSD